MVKIGQNGPKKLGNFRGFLKIILGKFLDFAGFLGDFFKLRVGSPGTSRIVHLVVRQISHTHTIEKSKLRLEIVFVVHAE